MLFTTTTQWVALAVALVAGWLFGLASHPGGRRWKQRYADEREAHAGYRRDQDARIAELTARVRDLEQENARLARSAPATATTIAPHAQPVPVARPAYPAGSGNGWFNWRNRARTTV